MTLGSMKGFYEKRDSFAKPIILYINHILLTDTSRPITNYYGLAHSNNLNEIFMKSSYLVITSKIMMLRNLKFS